MIIPSCDLRMTRKSLDSYTPKDPYLHYGKGSCNVHGVHSEDAGQPEEGVIVLGIDLDSYAFLESVGGTVHLFSTVQRRFGNRHLATKPQGCPPCGLLWNCECEEAGDKAIAWDVNRRTLVLPRHQVGK